MRTWEPKRSSRTPDGSKGLAGTSTPQSTYLVNFGLSEVQDYFFNIVKGFMNPPGFAVYRQDFNTDPPAHWQCNDAATRHARLRC